MILRGSVSLLIDSLFRAKQLANQAAAANVDSLLKVSTGNKSAAQVSSMTYEPKVKQNRVCYGKPVGKLSAGESFGQEALLQKEELLPFTVFADEHVELLTISMDVFDKTLLCYFQSMFLKRAKFLSQLEMFSKWSPHLLRQISIATKEKHYQLGECLFRQDMPVHSLYIIKSGSVKLSVSSNMNPQCHKDVVNQIEPERNYLAEIFAEDEEQEKKIMKNSVSLHALNTLSTASILTHSMSQVSIRSSFSRQISVPITSVANQRQRKSSTAAVPVKIKEPVHSVFGFTIHAPTPKNSSTMCDLGVGDTLCDIEALCHLNRQLFDAVCSSDTEVYVLDIYYFEQSFHKKAPHTVYQMVNRASQRVESWKERYALQFFNPLLTVLGQLEEKLSSKGYCEGGGKKVVYSSEEIAHIAIEKLGKVITNDKKGDLIDGTILDEADNTSKDAVPQTQNCSQDELSATCKLPRQDPDTIICSTQSSAFSLKKPTRPLSCTNCLTSVTNPTFIRFNSLQPRKIYDYEVASQSVYPNGLSIPPPPSYPVQQEKLDDVSTTVLNEYDLESDDSDSIVHVHSPRCSANLAKIRSGLLEKIKSESNKQLQPISNPISTLMWGSEQQRLESSMRGDLANLQAQPIVVPTAVRMDSISTVESEVFEKDSNYEQALIDLCDSKQSIEQDQDKEVETLITNEQPSSVSSGNNKQHQDDHEIKDPRTETTESLTAPSSLYKPTPTPPASVLLDHNDTTIPEEYKALMKNRPSSQKSFFSSSLKHTSTKRPSTAPSLCVSENRNGSQVVGRLETKTSVNMSVLTIYTLSTQRSVPCR